MSKRAVLKKAVERLVAAIAWVATSIPEQPDGHPYEIVTDVEGQLQYECEHSDGAETIVVATLQDGEWEVRAMTLGHRGTYREDLDEYPSKRIARKAMERWMERNPSGIQPEGQFF